MKKLIILTIIVLETFSAEARQKGFYLTAGGSLGANLFCYTLNNDSKSVPQLGFGGNLGLQYFFTKHWGFGAGVGLSFYNSEGHYSNSSQNDPVHYSFNDMYDDDPGHSIDNYKHYNLLLELNKWTETQKGYFLEIPLMLMYQTKWGISEKVGMYFGIGAKMQVPVISRKYEVKEGSELSVSAYYPGPDMTLPDPNGPDVSRHGYGTNTKTNFSGNMDLKMGFAASGELGFLFALSRRVDFNLGVYLDYGFTDIKEGNKTSGDYLINPENNAKTIQPSGYTGDHLQYNGYINSHAVDKVNLLGIGGKAGLRIKLGKLTESKTQGKKTKQNFIEKSRADTTEYRSIESLNPAEKNQPAKDELKIINEPIFFDLDKDILLPASIIVLDRKAAVMKKYPDMRLLIAGNTCNLGTGQYNIKLGQRRAAAAQKYLESQGIERNRISIATQSFTHPLKPNINEENREWNRRCDFYPEGQ